MGRICDVSSATVGRAERVNGITGSTLLSATSQVNWIVCVFVCLLFNGIFSTNRLYRVIEVWSISHRAQVNGKGQKLNPYKIETFESIAKRLAQLIRSKFSNNAFKGDICQQVDIGEVLLKHLPQVQRNIFVHDFFCFRYATFYKSSLTRV